MNAKEPLALDIKSASLYALRIVLHRSDTAALMSELDKRMQEAGGFFEDEAVVIDAGALSEAPAWNRLVQALRQHGLRPMGVVAPPALMEAAIAAGLTPVDLSAPAPRPAAEPAPVEAPPAATAPAQTAAPATATRIVNGPLRSGQRIYAQGGDLVVIGMVSQGAEVIADGHVHVYGPLRGKAIAGAHGNTQARIFTTRLEPELIAIAGVYRVIETQLEPGLYQRPTLIELDGDSLQIRALDR